ncbi:two-component system histidine kinase PnpS [Oceanobacillus alkalisoli]|uniref:two-component system histidine kinase PnpS n=1 Tax=Oceanobacillus alkalisoli TaxID=2925113 RepID=UPI001EE49869|nr:ATP-binding protein [Oceanobacillus alkalisoli]MCG5103626.1 ATP-binding protein [Oceanobacillus alkalisoli]
MSGPFSKVLLSYMVGLFIIVLIAGLIISTLVENIIFLIAVLVIVFVSISVLFIRIYNDYILPIEQASDTINEIGKGNYRARFHNTRNPLHSKLSTNINKLARELTEFSLQEQIQSEQLSTLIDNMASGLVLLDERGYIHLVNRKFIDLFGKTEKDYVGYLYYNVLENETLQETIQKVFLYEGRVKDTFKHYIGIENMYIEISGAPIINERNILKGAVLVLHDITELKKLEGMRKDFVANVSHELRTPITSIKGFSETLLDGNLDDLEAVSQFLQIIYHESNRIQILIEDLLSLSKLESESFRLVLHKINAPELVESLMPALVFKAEQKDIFFTTEVEDIQFKADKDRISQVIINLVNNALNYTPEKGEVSLSIFKAGSQVKIEVRDTGIGIPEDELPRVFERFYRVDKARARDSGGTGLGLAIVKHIVEVHDGEIRIDSEPDQGTIIRVCLPA